ncbi:MAG: response regulator [Anaerolineae bacterium]|nr:response regulator [Anaerolineae bacterium]MEB2287251.1 response regulator [Anaerolineae bacterium]
MGARILFVEDNDDLRKSATLMLEMEGFAVVGAEDGRAALGLIETGFHPDLIISDIMMPRVDGYQFFEAVRRDHPHLRAVPFIFLTARGARRDITAGKLLGVDDYLVKPLDSTELLGAVKSKLRRVAEMRDLADETLGHARQTLVELLAHELRTPLTYVTGGSALLAEELERQQLTPLSEDIRASLELIQSGAQRLNRLAEQAALYAQIASGQVASRIRTTSSRLNLAFLVHDALSLVNGITHEHAIAVQQAPSGDEALCVIGLRALLINAISEIIRNAVQHSPAGSTVTILLGCTETQAILTVTDQGTGMDEGQQAMIWDLLIQLERPAGEHQGAGLGLPLAKGIVEAHSGEIDLVSAPGVGTQVTIRLPLAPSE